MITHDEKRDYIRMDVDCDVTYKLADSSQTRTGRCTTLSGAGVSFIAEQAFDLGSAMEISIHPKSTITPPMTSFIEVVRCLRLEDGSFEIAGTIQSIKAI